MERKVVVGQVVGLHGVAGEIKVKPLTDFPERFSEGNVIDVLLEKMGYETEAVAIKSVRSHKNNLLVKLKGVETRDEAKRYLGAFFQVDEHEVMPLPEDSYYQFHLIGMNVYCESGENLGILSEILETPHNDVFVVRGETEILVPALRKVVKKIDLGKREMWIDREMIEYFED